MATNKIGLASGVVPEFQSDPVSTIRAAAAGGWDMVGLWVDETWTDETTKNVLTALQETRLEVIDVEVIRINPGPLDPLAFRILDVGVAIGARNALVMSDDPDIHATSEKLGMLCEYVEKKRSDLRINLEFGYFSEVKTIHDATRILDQVNHPSAAVLVDVLHLCRGGSTAEDVRAIPRDRISYAQICDGLAKGPSLDDKKAILYEAVWERLHVGEGELDVKGVVEALPDGTPLSVEMRSRALMEAYSDAKERSRVTAEKTREFLRAI